jgi:hypothetical protein
VFVEFLAGGELLCNPYSGMIWENDSHSNSEWLDGSCQFRSNRSLGAVNLEQEKIMPLKSLLRTVSFHF